MHGYQVKFRWHTAQIHTARTFPRYCAPQAVRMNARNVGYGELVATAAPGKRAAICEFVPLP